MIATAAPRWTAWRPGPRRFLSVVCALLFVGCAAALVGESSRRRAIANVAARGPADLPPAVLETAGILESDGAALIVVEAVLEAGGSASAPGPDGTVLARELILETVVRRPGSAHARLLLGRSAPGAAGAGLWKRPLELASTAAPGLDPAAVALAQRYLGAWGALTPEERSEAEARIARAFLDGTFLRSAFSLTVQRVGPVAAVRMVPEDPVALETAFRIARASGLSRAEDLLAERRKSLPPAAASRPTP
jgi:hypothetical protein